MPRFVLMNRGFMMNPLNGIRHGSRSERMVEGRVHVELLEISKFRDKLWDRCYL